MIKLFLKGTAALNYEDGEEVSVLSQTTNNLRQTFTIRLNDVDEKPTEMQLSPSRSAEILTVSDAVAQKLADITAVDEDTSPNFLNNRVWMREAVPVWRPV